MRNVDFGKWSAISSSLALLVTLAACGGSTAPTTAPTAPPATSQPAAATDTPASQAAGQKDLLDIIKERGVLRVSTDPNYAPQSYFDDKTKQWTGFDIDTATEVAKRLGVKVEFITPQWDAITAGNWAGRWDISIGSMTITPEREKVLDFTPPYYYSLAQFAIRSDLSGTIKTVADLAGKNVCVAKSTTYEDYMNGKLDIPGIVTQPPKGANVLSVDTDQLCIQSIQSGRKDYDAVLTAANVVNDGIQKGAPIVALGKPVYSEPLAIAIDKSSAPNQKLVDTLTKIVNDMHSDGTLTKMSMKYYGIDLSVVPK